MPDLGIPAIKAKIDTGARTSALHVFKLERINRNGTDSIKFWIHPLQRRTDFTMVCESPLIAQRMVRDSGGHTENRYVIATMIELGGMEWEAEITLTSREDMQFRMLLGRSALTSGGFCIDPGKSYLTGRKLRRAYPVKKEK